MEYEVLYTNDDATARVRMTINGHVLDQDIPLGQSDVDLQTNVTQAMAVFNAELIANNPTPPYTPPLNQPQTVDSLPAVDNAQGV